MRDRPPRGEQASEQHRKPLKLRAAAELQGSGRTEFVTVPTIREKQIDFHSAMSKINCLIFGPLIARRTYAATWALLIAWVCFAPWPGDAAEINAATSAKPSGFADIVAKVKPAVIAVIVIRN